jgi:hypothetical protein
MSAQVNLSTTRGRASGTRSLFVAALAVHVPERSGMERIYKHL